MKKLSIISSNLLLMVVFNSCSHYYYMPNVQNVPIFRQKGESRMSIQSGSASEASTTELHAAYAITSRFAIMANYMFVKGGRQGEKNNWGKGKYYEAAFGYYKPLNKKIVFEVYAGGGISNQQHEYAGSNYYGGYYYDGTSDLAFTKVFLQPSVGIKLKPFDFALSTRLSSIHFYNINNQIRATNSSGESRSIDKIANNKNSLLLESAFTIRGGWQRIKLQLQLQFSSNLTHKDLQFENSNTSFGIYLNFSNKDLQTIFGKHKK